MKQLTPSDICVLNSQTFFFLLFVKIRSGPSTRISRLSSMIGRRHQKDKDHRASRRGEVAGTVVCLRGAMEDHSFLTITS